jgi:hypothetical protein
MFVKLNDEAVNRAGDPNIPGGAAMVMLGPGADIEAWGYVQLSAIVGRLKLGIRGTTEHQRKLELDAIAVEDLEPPLSFLASWADIVREARGQAPSTRRASIGDEIDYLRSALDWMLSVNDEGEMWFIQVEDFARGLRKVRRAMEAVLHDGERADRINARCKECDEAPQLCVRKAEGVDGRDFWQCPSCRQGYDEWGVRRCWRKMFVDHGEIPEWLHLRQAAAAVGRPVSTVRTWTLATDGRGNPKRPRVKSKIGDDDRTWVCWADVRAVDDMTRRRGRQRLIA